MIILPYVKMGIIPFGSAIIKSKKVFPNKGEIVFMKQHRVKSKDSNNPWIKVKIDEIINNDIYFVSKI